MLVNRIIDNAAVSAAAVVRRPVTTAREQALAHPGRPGATVFGVDGSYLRGVGGVGQLRRRA